MSTGFLRLIREAVESDHIFQAQVERIDKQRLLYRELLFSSSEELREVDRLKKDGLGGGERENEINGKYYPTRLLEISTDLNKESDELPAVTKRRERALKRLFQAAEGEIDDVPNDGDAQMHHIPNTFFRYLQRTLDACESMSS